MNIQPKKENNQLKRHEKRKIQPFFIVAHKKRKNGENIC